MKNIIDTDIFIAGAGAAGIAAAVAASELGMNVCVAEKNVYPGGRATASVVGTICGMYLRSNHSAEYAMHGFPKNFAERLMHLSGKKPVKFSDGLWFLSAHPNDFEKIAIEFLSHSKIKVFYNLPVIKVEASSNKITSICCSYENEKINVIPKMVIDCSGEGIICSMIDHEIIRDTEYQAAAIVFSLKNIFVVDEFQLSFSLLKLITKQIDEGKVPEYFNLLSIIPHSLIENTIQFKMGLPWKIGVEEGGSIYERAIELIKELIIFIKSSIPGFEKSELNWIAKEIGVRTGIRAKGKSILSDADVLSAIKTTDGICNGAWPVEYWRTGNKRVEMTFFAENDYYSIPAGCLESGIKENLFFAGKMISAEEKAIASARVIGTCFGTGYAAGVLASFKVQNKSREDAIDFIRQKMTFSQ